MATSSWPTTNHSSADLTESAGAILFNHYKSRICILKYQKWIGKRQTTEYLLPKGRRNWNESRAVAAVREIEEETGYACKLLDVDMQTRCTQSKQKKDEDGENSDEEEDEDEPDEVRTARGKGEPFMLQMRQMGEGKVKLIWWFLARSIWVGTQQAGGYDNSNTMVLYGMQMAGRAEQQFRPEWYEYDEAVEMLTFENDREVVRKAIEIVTANFDADGKRRV